jgi:sortase A
MKILVRNPLLREILKWLQRVLFLGATLLLGYCAFVLADTWIFQHRQRQALERLTLERQAQDVRQQEASPGKPVRQTPAVPASLPAIGPDGLIGRIEIPRIGVSVVVVEGTDRATLRRAAGHIVGTALPGQIGNVGIAAHRDTFFRPLRNIQIGDNITLTTLRGQFPYRVVSTKVVDPYDVAVLNPDGGEILTLVTCYPFYFVGSAPNRFIVRAERILSAIE